MKVYCGNGGGFENTGKTVTFQTQIPEPGTPTLGASTSTSVSLSWVKNSYAEWYRIEYSVEAGGKKAGNGETLFEAKHVGASVEVTDLEPGTSYNVHVFSGRGSSPSGYEPHGVIIKATTLGGFFFLSFPFSCVPSLITIFSLLVAGNGSNGNLEGGAIAGIIIGVLVLVGLLGFGAFLVVRQTKKTSELGFVMQRMVSHSTFHSGFIAVFSNIFPLSF